MEYQKSYVYTSENRTKRRRVEPTGLDSSLASRKHAYHNAWGQQQAAIDEVIKEAYQGSVNEIVQYVKDQPATVDRPETRLRTALLVSHGDTGSSSQVFDELALALDETPDTAFLCIRSTECPNLKALLKLLNQKALSAAQDASSAILAPARSCNSTKVLLYDLQILRDWCVDEGVQRVVIGFEDGEAFDALLMADVISLLRSWSDRIPFVLVFGIVTSLNLFEDRLSRSAIRSLEGRQFSLPNANTLLNKVFELCMASENDLSLQLGPGLCEMLIQRQASHLNSVEAFIRSMQYAYMCHYHNNALSIFLVSTTNHTKPTKEHFEAVRNLNSFQRRSEELTVSQHNDRVRELRESDEALHQYIRDRLKESRAQLQWTHGALSALSFLCQTLLPEPAISWPELYCLAFSGRLASNGQLCLENRADAPTLDSLYSAIKRAPAASLIDLISHIEDKLMAMPPSELAQTSPDDFHDLKDEIEQLVHAQEASGNTFPPPNTQTIPRKSTRKAASSLSTPQKPASTGPTPASTVPAKLATQLITLLKTYFVHTLRPYTSIFLHELLFYTPKSPHRDVFTKNPRTTIELALSNPHHYIGCACCALADSSDNGIKATQPPTAILYQLYLDCGALINVADLWDAFRQAVGETYGDDEVMVMALFYRGLAELKMMGLLKGSRRKVDCVEKLAWKGL